MPTHRFIWTSLLLLLSASLGCREKATKEQMLSSLSPELRRKIEVGDSTPLVTNGVTVPNMVAAEKAEVADEQEVIGVIIEGSPRAYPLRQLSNLLEHVVNDHVLDPAGSPKAFAVTYCNLTGCIRVLESPVELGGKNLGVGTIGLIDGGLVLSHRKRQFKQEEQVSTLRDLPYEVMTWKDWKQKNPSTLVYIGPAKSIRQ